MTRSSQLTPRHFVLLGLLLCIALPRFIGLGTVLTIDEPLWQSRGDTFIQAFSSGNFSKTLVAGQPGVTTAWLVGLAAPANSLATDQAAIAFMTALLILIITYFAVYLWGFRWGVIAGFILALDPFLLGHSRVVHTDALLALFYLSSVLTLLAGLYSPRTKNVPVWRYVIFSAVMGGAALLTKMFALILIPTVGIIVFGAIYQKNFSWKVGVKTLLLWLGIFVVTIFIAWPALWTNPGGVYSYLFERVALHSEGTSNDQITSSWWYYIRESTFRLTATTILFLPLTIVALRFGRKNSMRQTVGWLLLSATIYVIAMSFSSDKGDRYILFALTTFTLSAILGLRFLINTLQGKWPRYAHLFSLIPFIVIGFLLIDVIRLHPHYLAHYNQLYPIEDDHKLGWGEGLELAAAWIESEAQGASVATFYPRVFEYFYDGSVESASHHDSKDYLIIYRSMFERGPDNPDTELVNEFLRSDAHTPIHIVTVNRLPYAWIFKLK